MNVSIQSLFACPAFFNMLEKIGQTEWIEESLKPEGMLKKFVHTAKYFGSLKTLDDQSEFGKAKVVDAEQIFWEFLLMFNPDDEQQDAQDFLCYMLDQLHEEMKKFYYPNKPKTTSKQDGSWQDVSNIKEIKQF